MWCQITGGAHILYDIYQEKRAIALRAIARIEKVFYKITYDVNE